MFARVARARPSARTAAEASRAPAVSLARKSGRRCSARRRARRACRARTRGPRAGCRGGGTRRRACRASPRRRSAPRPRACSPGRARTAAASSCASGAAAGARATCARNNDVDNANVCDAISSCAPSRTRRADTSRPKIRRNDVDATEREAVVSGAARGRRRLRGVSLRPAFSQSFRCISWARCSCSLVRWAKLLSRLARLLHSAMACSMTSARLRVVRFSDDSSMTRFTACWIDFCVCRWSMKFAVLLRRRMAAAGACAKHTAPSWEFQALVSICGAMMPCTVHSTINPRARFAAAALDAPQLSTR